MPRTGRPSGKHDVPRGATASNSLYHRYKSNAKKRGYDFGLSKPEALALFAEDCHYCGIPPSAMIFPQYANGPFTYTGIDRIDNDKGYVAGNVLPCCKQCNRAKYNMTYDEFISYLKRAGAWQVK